MDDNHVLLYQKDSTIEVLKVELKSSNEKNIYRVIQPDNYIAANVLNKKICLLTKSGEQETGLLVDDFTQINSLIYVYGYENYATATSVKVTSVFTDEINETIEYPKYDSIAKIVINNCEFNYKTNGYDAWEVDILNKGYTKFIIDKNKHNKNSPKLLIGFEDKISNIQMVKNYI